MVVFNALALQNLGTEFTTGLTVVAGVTTAFCSAKTDRAMPSCLFDFRVGVVDFRKGFLVLETGSGLVLVLSKSLSTLRLLYLTPRDATISCTATT